jgi:chemotaxis protein histidine kinase CheA
MSNPAQAETVMPPNPLEKAKNGNGPVSIDPSVLKRAEESVEKLSEDYSSFAQADVDGIKTAIARAESKPEERMEAIAEIYTRALDLKGQGGGFGYNLITSIGDLLTKFLEGKEDLSPREFEIVYAHVDAMQAVLRAEMKDGGDKIGVQIVDGLSQLVLKG